MFITHMIIRKEFAELKVFDVIGKEADVPFKGGVMFNIASGEVLMHNDLASTLDQPEQMPEAIKAFVFGMMDAPAVRT